MADHRSHLQLCVPQKSYKRSSGTRALISGLLGAWYVKSTHDVYLLTAHGYQVFEIATNRPLFPLSTFGYTRGQILEEHQNMIKQYFGNGLFAGGSFEALLEQSLPADVQIDDRRMLARFLRSSLELEVSKRRNVKQLLLDPWITG